MATIKPRRGSTYPTTLSENELAVDSTNRVVYLGSPGGTGITVASHLTNYVVSVNGSTGAITAVAFTNVAQTFTAGQTFSSATTNPVDIIGDGSGIGLRVASSGQGRIGAIRLGRSSTNAYNSLIYQQDGTISLYAGNTVADSNNLIFQGTTATTQIRNNNQRLEVLGYIAPFSPASVRLYTNDGDFTSYYCDLIAPAPITGNITNTLPSTTGTLLNTTSAYVSGICGATGAVTLSAGSNMTITRSGNTFTFASTASGSGSGAGVSGGTGISVSFDGTTYTVSNTGVLSVNGSTGAITNIAVTNTAQSFSGLQSFIAGISAAGITLPSGGKIIIGGGGEIDSPAGVLNIGQNSRIYLGDGNVLNNGTYVYVRDATSTLELNNPTGNINIGDAAANGSYGAYIAVDNGNGNISINPGNGLTTTLSNKTTTSGLLTASGGITASGITSSGRIVCPFIVTSFNGSTGDVQGVASFNGSTGAVQGVASFNGSTGAVQGVASVNGLTGAVKVGRSISVYAPTTTDNITMFYTSNALTLSNIESVIRGAGTGVTFSIRHGTDRSASGTEVVTNGINCSNTTNGLSTTSFNNGTISASSFVWMTIAGVSGNPNELSVTLEF
jgi:hypothetical protein